MGRRNSASALVVIADPDAPASNQMKVNADGSINTVGGGSSTVGSVTSNVTVGSTFTPGTRIAVMPTVAGSITFAMPDSTTTSAYLCPAGVLSVFPIGANKVTAWTGTGPIDVWH